jgi:hypothetical protein
MKQGEYPKMAMDGTAAWVEVNSSFGENVRCMVMNGKIGPEFSAIWNPPIFNADGSRYA